ncbi:tyrosine--tRNA ligase, partial [Candidatus Peregrinibacteria bacterium]|nr:tyrosine--tRNA ligase [Candidatus Peregrinibacteria bacterium]
NMLAGRTLQHVFKKRDKFVLTTKLIEGTDGRKMSKTYDNCIFLEDEAKDMYGKILSIKDDLIVTYMECCTDIPMDEVKKAAADLKKGSVNPKDLKMRLAREIVTLYHSAEDAADAEAEFQKVHKDKGVPDDIPNVKVQKDDLLIDVIAKEKLAPSKAEARRLIEQGGVKMNDHTVQKIDGRVQNGILKVGKRKFVKLVVV